MVNRTTFVSVADGDQLSMGYFNGIQSVVGGIGTATATTIVPPIGSILAWHKSFTGVPALPGAWVQCDGQTISDSDSPMNGQTLPNLNGGARFLMGTATTSGTLAGSVTHSHSLVGANAIASGSNVPNTTDSVDHLPPYMSIFWIMRIK